MKHRECQQYGKVLSIRHEGVKIINLVRYRRNMVVSLKKEEVYEEPAIAARDHNEFYNNVRMPVLTEGKRTPLRWLLKGIQGVC